MTTASYQAYRQGQVLFAANARVEAKQTTPPQPYTQDTLIDDMMSAHKFGRNEAERSILRTIAGIGTSRTRSSIIKGLITKGYVASAKKGKLHQLRITPHGTDFIAKLPAPVKSVSMTALWEKALAQIVAAEVQPEQFRRTMRSQVVKLVTEAFSPPGAPKCSSEVASATSVAASQPTHLHNIAPTATRTQQSALADKSTGVAAIDSPLVVPSGPAPGPVTRPRPPGQFAFKPIKRG